MSDVTEDRISEFADRSVREASIAEFGSRALTGAPVEELTRLAALDSAVTLGVERAAVLTVRGDALHRDAAWGWPDDELATVPLAGRSHLAHVCAVQEPIAVLDLANDSRFTDSKQLSRYGLVSAVAVPIRGGRDRALGVLVVHGTSRRAFGSEEIVYLRSLANVLAAAIARERAETASRRTQERLRFLAEASSTLASSLSAEETLERLAALSVATFADWCSVELEFDGARRTVAIAYGDAAKAEHAAALRQGSSILGSLPVPHAGVLYAEADVESFLAGADADVARTLRALGLASLIAVPLVTRNGVLGVVALVRVEAGVPYDDDDLLFAREFVRRASVAVENAMLHQVAVRAAEQVRRTQRVTAELAEATTPQEVAETIASSGAVSVGAAAGWVAELSPDGESLVQLASVGYEAQPSSRSATIRIIERDPATDALERGEPLFFRSAAEFRAAYPDLPHGYEAMAVVPVIAGSDPAGVLAFNFSDEHAFDDEERRLLDSLAKLYAQSLVRARLYATSQERERAAFILARLGEVLQRATTVTQRARRAASVLIEELAGFAAVDLLDGERRLRRAAWAGHEPEPRAEWRTREGELARRAIVSGRPQRFAEGGPARWRLDALPLRARGHTIGVVLIGGPEGRGAVGVDDPKWLDEVAVRIALALDNAVLFEQESSASRLLQQGLLGGELPDVAAADLAAAYRPASETNQVGGDFYDAFALEGGPLALVVGDVVGHDLHAAIAMCQLRAAVRALAVLGGPSELTRRLDGFVASLHGAQMATLAYVEIDASRTSMRYLCAGHPPPLVLSPHGTPRYLWQGRSPPLGSVEDDPRPEATEPLAAGETIVVFTDGLVERRSESLMAGLDRLADVVRGSHDEPLVTLREHILEQMLGEGGHEDDVCLVLARIRGD